jgi:hypothetical protein
MLMLWDHQLIDPALQTLTKSQRNALDLASFLQTTKFHIGTKRLADYGFVTKAEYENELAAAREQVKMYLTSLGINKLSDLDFDERATSSDGRLYANSGK